MSRVRRVGAIALCAGLAAGLGGIAGGAGLRTSRAAQSVPTMQEHASRMAAAQDLLSSRVAALRARDKRSWMATVDNPGSAFGRRQSLIFDNLLKLPIADFSYGTASYGKASNGTRQPTSALAAERAEQLGPGAWVTTVPGTYSLAGFDRVPRSFEMTYTLVQRTGGWRFADDADTATALQLWDLPGLKVLRGRSGIVIGNAPEERMRDYSAIADSAVRRVSDVWGTDWNSDVVVVTPSTAEEFAGLLLHSADGRLDQVAAVAQGVITSGQRARGDQIVINPRTFTALQPNGRRVVVTHELTHVAARSSTTGPVPTWLSEGMADYIGYSGLHLPRARVASELIALVRAGKGFNALPSSADFDPSRTRIAPSYSASWLAVSRLVDLFGEGKVVAFYRMIAGGPAAAREVGWAARSDWVDADASAALAFSRSFGMTESRFVDDWKRYLQTLAHPRR